MKLRPEREIRFEGDDRIYRLTYQMDTCWWMALELLPDGKKRITFLYLEDVDLITIRANNESPWYDAVR